MESSEFNGFLAKEETLYKIVKSNKLVGARQSYSALQQRAILLAIVQMKPEDEELHDYKIYLSDLLAGQASKKASSHYPEVRREIEKLTETAIKIEDEHEWHSYAFVSHAWGEKGKSFVNLRFSPEVKNILLGIRKNYTAYIFENVSKFRGNYSLRLYELCKQYQKIGRREIAMDRLRFILSLENKYPNFSNFKTYVLDPSLREVNACSDIRISFRAIKEGRRVSALEFTIRRAPLEKGALPQKDTGPQSALFGLTQARYNALLERYGAEYLQEKKAVVASFCSRKKGQHNKAGLFIKACEEDWQDEAAVAAARQQREMEEKAKEQEERQQRFEAIARRVAREMTKEQLDERLEHPLTYGLCGNIWQRAGELRR